MGDVEVDYAKLCGELELQEQEVCAFAICGCARLISGTARGKHRKLPKATESYRKLVVNTERYRKPLVTIVELQGILIHPAVWPQQI